MPAQMRLNASDSRMYSPDRDLAWCTPHLVNQALRGLDPGCQEPWVVAYLEEHKITNEHLCDAAVVIATYMNSTVIDPQYKQPLDALKAAGFFDLPDPIQVVILAKLGQLLISVFFPCIRDVTRGPEEPAHNVKEFADIADNFQKLAAKLRSTPKWRRKLSAWILKLRHKIGI